MDSSNGCTWPEIRQRAHYLCWLGAALATAVLIGLTVDLALVAITGGTIGLDLIPLVYLCVIMSPSIYAWRKHGEAFCGFLELEQAFDRALYDTAPERTPAFAEIVALMEQIDSARGMERQVVRNETKAWLLAHAHQLSREEREYVADHLGYLHRG